MVPKGTNREIGRILRVNLDSGVDLNALYTHGGFGESPGLHFFHDTVAGRAFFSCESPDVYCHEMGYAVFGFHSTATRCANDRSGSVA